jgi:hypothetical protein
VNLAREGDDIPPYLCIAAGGTHRTAQGVPRKYVEGKQGPSDLASSALLAASKEPAGFGSTSFELATSAPKPFLDFLPAKEVTPVRALNWGGEVAMTPAPVAYRGRPNSGSGRDLAYRNETCGSCMHVLIF